MPEREEREGPKLSVLCNELSEVECKILKLGTQLGVPMGKLMEFQKRDDPLSATLHYWLCGNVDGAILTWDTVVAALRSNHVGESGLAGRIEERYCSKVQVKLETQDSGFQSLESQPDYMSDGNDYPCSGGNNAFLVPGVSQLDASLISEDSQPAGTSTPGTQLSAMFGEMALRSPSARNNMEASVTPKRPRDEVSSDSDSDDEESSTIKRMILYKGLVKKPRSQSPPDLEDYDGEDKEAFFCDIEETYHVIRREFTRFTMSIFKLLKKISVMDLKISFQTFIQGNYGSSPFREKVLEKLTQATKHDEIFAAVMDCCSFCDYEIIEDIIKAERSAKARRELNKYSKKYSECVWLVRNNAVKCGCNTGQKRVTFKLDKEHLVRGKNVISVTKTIGRILGIRTSQLHLVQIREGCLNFDFEVPDCVLERVSSLNREEKIEFFKHSVTFINSEVATSEKVASDYNTSKVLPSSQKSSESLPPGRWLKGRPSMERNVVKSEKDLFQPSMEKLLAQEKIASPSSDDKKHHIFKSETDPSPPFTSLLLDQGQPVLWDDDDSAVQFVPLLQPRQKARLFKKVKAVTEVRPQVPLKYEESQTLILKSRRIKQKFKPSIVDFDSSSSESDSDFDVDYDYDVSCNINDYLRRHSSWM